MRRWPTVLVAGSLGGLALLFWEQRVVATVRLPQTVDGWNADLYTIYYEVYTFAYRSARLLPRWNPYQLAGMPFLANYNGGFLYPANFLAAVMPVHLAIGWVTALHVALAGTSTFLVARWLGVSAAAAVVAAVGFMFNGYLTIEVFRPSYLAGLAWIPAVFLCAARMALVPGWRRGVLLGVVLALQFLTGHGQSVCYSVYALLVLAPVYLVYRGEWRVSYLRRVTGATVLAFAVAGGLAAVQLLPTMELVTQAVRGFGGLSLDQTRAWTPSWQLAAQAACSSGIVLLAAVVALAARPRSPVVGGCVLMIVFSVLVGLGTAFYRDVFFALPGVRLFRNPHGMLLVGAFALALLAGIGIDAAGNTRGWGRAALVLVAAGLPLLVARLPAMPRGFAMTLAAGLGLLCLVPGGRTRAAGAWVLAALVIAERFLSSHNTVMMPQNNAAGFFAAPPFVDFLRAHDGGDRALVIWNWRDRFPLTAKAGTLYRFPVVQDYEPLAPAVYHDFLRPLEDANVDAPLFWGRVRPPPSHPGWRELDLLATRWVVVAPGVRWPVDGSDRFTAVYEGRDARILENRRALPRARLVTAWRVEPDPHAALAAVTSPDFDPRAETVVDRPPAWASEEQVAATAAAARVVELGDETMTVEVQAPQPALLVVADLYWPGWKATVDGSRRDILRADYLLRGVAVDAGAHVVRLWYDPWTLKLGAAVTMGTLAALLVAAAAQGRRRGLDHPLDEVEPAHRLIARPAPGGRD